MPPIRPTDLRIRHYFDYFVSEQIYLQHPEIVILTNILPDPTNTYLASYRASIVDEINGKKIRTLADLAQAFAETPDRFVVRMIGDGPPLVLDRKEVEAARERIKTRYNVVAEQNLDEQSPPAKPRRDSQTRLKMSRISLLIFALFCSSLILAEAKKAPVQTAVKPKELSLVRVNVTGQAHDYFRPWQKKAPFSKRALGAVLPQGRVLVTADLVSNQNYVELERAETGDKMAANVIVIDYEANLALLEPVDKKFLDGLTPLQLAMDTTVGDRLYAWQLEPTGALVVTEGLVTTVQMMRYPAEVGQFLAYRVSISMQYRDNSYTVPLVKNNKLAALLLRYDSRAQVLDAIPAPIIAHFLKDAAGPAIPWFSFRGFRVFPDAEIRTFGPLRDKLESPPAYM